MELEEGRRVRDRVQGLADALQTGTFDHTRLNAAVTTLLSLLGLDPMDAVTRYCYEVRWDEGKESYFATVREFPKLGAEGESAEEALAELKVLVREKTEEQCHTPLPSVIPLKSGQ